MTGATGEAGEAVRRARGLSYLEAGMVEGKD